MASFRGLKPTTTIATTGGGGGGAIGAGTGGAQPLTAASVGLSCIAIGASFDDLQKAATKDVTQPLFALVRFSLGAGTFKREKLVMLSLLYDTVPTLRRAKANQRRGDIAKLFGDVSLTLPISDPKDLEVEALLSGVSRNIKVDEGTGSLVNIKQLREDYEAIIAAAAAAAAASGSGSKHKSSKHKVSLSSGVGRKTALELGSTLKTDAILAEVHASTGLFNWSLYHPTEASKPLSLVNAGSLSVLEMKRWLKDDLVAFGLLRMGFGTGKFKRTKFIFFSFCGPKAPISARAKLQGCKANMRSALGHCNMEMQASTPEEIALPAVIAKVKSVSVVDGDEVHTADAVYNITEFMNSLKEEVEKGGNFFGDTGEIGLDDDDDDEGGGGGKGGGDAGVVPVATAVADIRKNGSSVLWGVFAATNL